MKKQVTGFLQDRIAEYNQEIIQLTLIIEDSTKSMHKLRDELEKLNSHMYVMNKMVEWGYDDTHIKEFLRKELNFTEKYRDSKQSAYNDLSKMETGSWHKRERIKSKVDVLEKTIKILDEEEINESS